MRVGLAQDISSFKYDIMNNTLKKHAGREQETVNSVNGVAS